MRNVATRWEGEVRKHRDQMHGMGESEEACLTITTKRYKSSIEMCFEVHDIA